MSASGLRQQIHLKNSPQPYAFDPTVKAFSAVATTDHFLFPYYGYWMGDPLHREGNPKINARRAGWAPRMDPYVLRMESCPGCPPPDEPHPGRCFQVPCTTVFTCNATSSLPYI